MHALTGTQAGGRGRVNLRQAQRNLRPAEEIAKQRIDFAGWIIGVTTTPELRISAGFVHLAHHIIIGGQDYNIVPAHVAETDLAIPMTTPGVCYAYLEARLFPQIVSPSYDSTYLAWKMTAINPTWADMPSTDGVFWRKIYFEVTVPDYSATDRTAPSVAHYRHDSAAPVSLGIAAPTQVGDVLACREFDEDGVLIALGSETGTSWANIDTGHSLWWYPTPLTDLLP
jgi:hypothetical protein